VFRSFEANSWTIERKGSEDLAKSSAPAVDQSYLGQAPNFERAGTLLFIQKGAQYVFKGNMLR
jgi:hypothetical protein